MFSEDQIQRIKALLLKQLKGELTSSEKAELNAWAEISDTRNAFIEEITDERMLNQKLRLFTRIKEKDIWAHKAMQDAVTAEEEPTPEPSRSFGFWRYVAASVLLLAGAGAIYMLLLQRENRRELPVLVGAQQAIAPGGDKAILTLSGGKRIVLDSAAIGYVASQGGTVISKNEQGQLTYNTGRDGSAAVEPEWSTIATPKGGQYRVVLPDSTRVWLNSASSLTFPSAFTGAGRSVEITGECYFEVAHDPDKPFKVNIAGQMQVEVLGTAFNVTAYPDERILAATLLDGSLLVRSGEQTAAGMKYKTQNTKLLKPGQQARVPATADEIHPDLRVVNLEHPDEVIAWKSGLLSFRNADIRQIMRQVSRWYDLEVIYNGDIPLKNYSGSILRKTELTEALEVLHLVSGARFELRGREVIVGFPVK